MNHGAGAPDTEAAGPRYSRSNPPPGVRAGVGVDNIASMPVDRTGDRGTGLENVPHRVLTYRDLVSLAPNPRTPTRSRDGSVVSSTSRIT